MLELFLLRCFSPPFHTSFYLLLPVCQASQASTVSTTSTTVQPTAARMVGCVWMVWTPTTASVHLITQVTVDFFCLTLKLNQKSIKKLWTSLHAVLYAPFQVSTAQRMWTSVSWCLMRAKMEEHATTLTAATTVSVSTGGRATTAARTSTTVPVQLVTTALPAMTA